jgi:hypothetical protein
MVVPPRWIISGARLVCFDVARLGSRRRGRNGRRRGRRGKDHDNGGGSSGGGVGSSGGVIAVVVAVVVERDGGMTGSNVNDAVAAAAELEGTDWVRASDTRDGDDEAKRAFVEVGTWNREGRGRRTSRGSGLACAPVARRRVADVTLGILARVRGLGMRGAMLVWWMRDQCFLLAHS